MSDQTRRELMIKLPGLQDLVCQLILQRDTERYRVCRYYETEFQLSIGEFEYLALKWKYETLRRRKLYLMISKTLPTGEAIFLPEYVSTMDELFAKDRCQLKRREQTLQFAKEHAELWYELSGEETAELSDLYCRIIPMVHPDFVSALDEYEEELFDTAIGAFSDGNLCLLEETVAEIEALPEREFPQDMRDTVDCPVRTMALQNQLRNEAMSWKQAAAQYDVEIGKLLGAE